MKNLTEAELKEAESSEVNRLTEQWKQDFTDFEKLTVKRIKESSLSDVYQISMHLSFIGNLTEYRLEQILQLCNHLQVQSVRSKLHQSLKRIWKKETGSEF